mmetsp:Transcript_16375/g.15694  ORF Transcript_16375/g.15694 Transcript_16375/m.15694 type:complete len:1227 (-) Transcript_16375:96-3776(-)
MVFSHICFSLVVIALFSSVVLGIFEEQAGEYDWKIDNIGIIQQSFNKNERTVVATADSVIASFNDNDGKLKWRIVLAAGTSVHQLISGQVPSGTTDVYSLTSSVSIGNDQSHYLLSAYSSEEGSLRWQISLGSKKSGLTDLVYDSSRYLITALSGNAIDVATVRGFLLWHWTPSLSEDTKILSNSKNGKQLFISQLTLPLPIALSGRRDTDSAIPSNIAVGCFAILQHSGKDSSSVYATTNPSSLLPHPAESSIPKCGNTAILSVILPSKLTVRSSAPLSERLPQVTAKIFAAMPDISVDSLRATIAMDGGAAYTATDLLFGLSNSIKPKVSVLNLLSNSPISIDVPLSSDLTTPAIQSPSGANLIMVNENGKIVPTIVYCINTISCQSFYLSSSKGSSVAKSGLKINSMSTCTTKSSGGDAVLGIERHSSYGSVATAISCAIKESILNEKDTCVNGDSMCTSDGVVLKISTVSAKTAEDADITSSFSFSVTVPPKASISHSALSFLSTTSTSNQRRALVVFSTGWTALYRSAVGSMSTGSGIGEEVWHRDEGLSRIKQAVIVEDTRNNALHLLKEAGEDLEAAPGFIQRISMQLANVMETFDDVKAFFKSFPEMFLSHAENGFGLLPSPIKFPEVLDGGVGIDGAAERRRRMKRELMSHGDRVKHAFLFGFNKLAICLSTSLEHINGDVTIMSRKERMPSGALMHVGKNEVGFSSAGLKIIGLDLLLGDEIWTFEPTLEQANRLSKGNDNDREGDVVVQARILTLHSSPLEAHISLVVSTKSGASYSWHIDASTGHILSATEDASSVQEKGPLVGVMALGKEQAHKGISQYLLMYSKDGSKVEEDVTVALHPSPTTTHKTSAPSLNITASNTLVNSYVHQLDRNKGILSTYQISSDLKGIPVATAIFPGPLASVSYPNFDDIMDSRYSVLGDNSILMKYVNPHAVLIAYFSPKEGDTVSSSTSRDIGRPLYAALVDIISSKILYRILLSETAAEPVHTLLVENHFIVTYWNTNAKRTELCSSALYEGMVDVFGLSPLSSFSAIPQQQRDANLSAFSSPNPLGIQRTYIIPRKVTSLHHTITSRGMAHKNILLGLAGGQLFSLDHRMIHPRRPLADPTLAEKEEGLFQYNPFIHIMPQQALTQDSRVAGEAVHVLTASVRLESTSLVLVFGGLDIFFTRASPSQGFDVLASDFNHPLLIFLLLILAIAVLGLRNIHNSKTLKQSWA